MVDEFEGFMKASTGRNLLWDIGALNGIFSLAFTLGRLGRRAFAFEPNPVSRQKLEECIHLNPAASVTVFDFPLGLPGEMVEFERGFHYTAVAGLSSRPSEEDLVREETKSVDGLIEKNLSPPDVIKIDVEGHEFEVLKGAKGLLFSRKPLLSIELHPGLLSRRGTSALAIAQFLAQAGYSFYDTRLKKVTTGYFKRRDNFRVFAM
ncbi:MAG TPA: FkbM family methyltransferase [Terracidiphilus sp.]|nr:FkbM family methyltransferase [Terracidiphilus sp.]